VVIIGGGIIGCNVAYHLAKRGWTDVVLLERHRLTAGPTWHAAGLVVTSGFTTETSVRIAKYTRDLSPAEIKQLWPLARTDDLLGGFLTEGDGRANPVDVTVSLAKGAAAAGVRILEGVALTGVTQKGGRVTGVVTDRGAIAAEYVVNCAGMWGREIGELAGVNVPLQSTEHYYLILEGVEGIERSWPVLEDPSNYAYLREESGRLMLGIFEPVAAAWALDGVPEQFAFSEIEPDIDRMMPFVQNALERVPAARSARVRQFFCGPESFTPDLAPLVGEAPELRNFFVAAGLNSLGILTGGGIGRLVANWIVDGAPDMDVTGFNIDRFQRFHANRTFRRDRSVEIVGQMYKVHFANKSFDTARGARRHVLHNRLARAGACFVQSAGWEIADWYAPEGEKASRASRLSRRRHRDGHVVHVEIPGAGPRCAGGARPSQLQRPRHAARAHHLHTVGQRARRHRGRPDGDARGRRGLPRGLLRHRPPARGDLDAPAHPGGLPRLHHRCDLGLRHAQCPGAQVPRAAG
jgi:4-methylaminobutanoate oxidase (formaldehyde-forming)